ncbi:MAG TPA: hypothetical protein VII08_18325 [Myxococcales bacterium]
MRHLAAALALVSLCACAGSYSNGGTDLLPPDSGGGALTDGGPPDGGSDGGVDGGPDAGCVQRSLNGVGAIDNCAGAPNATASVFVSDPAQGCTVSITLDTATTPCTGVASRGTLDAFDGGCTGGYVCTSPSLPGTLTCNNGFNTCTVRICDAGVCGP